MGSNKWTKQNRKSNEYCKGVQELFHMREDACLAY